MADSDAGNDPDGLPFPARRHIAEQMETDGRISGVVSPQDLERDLSVRTARGEFIKD